MAAILTEYLDSFVRSCDDKKLIAIPLAVLVLSLLVSGSYLRRPEHR